VLVDAPQGRVPRLGQRHVQFRLTVHRIAQGYVIHHVEVARGADFVPVPVVPDDRECVLWPNGQNGQIGPAETVAARVVVDRIGRLITRTRPPDRSRERHAAFVA